MKPCSPSGSPAHGKKVPLRPDSPLPSPKGHGIHNHNHSFGTASTGISLDSKMSSDSLRTTTSSAGSSQSSTAVRSPKQATVGAAPEKFDITERIRWVGDVTRYYSIGDEVMPSTHRGSKVCWGKRLKDGKDVVVKIRNKRISFKDEQDITDWKHNMEIVMNMPVKRTFFIARIYDICENQTDFYVIMEAVSGEDLFEYCAREKLYRRPDKADIAKQIALELFFGLRELGTLGLIHKDLKLENVVLDTKIDDSPPNTPKKLPQLGAFCKMVDFDTVEEYEPDHRCRDILGTDQYIAPEAYSGWYSPASDVWAVGVMLYKMLTGSFPFSEDLFDDEPGQNYVGHAKMKQIRCRLKLAKIDFSHDVWNAREDVRTFVKGCLIYDDSRRMTVHQALEHPWLEGAAADLQMRLEMFYGC